VTNVSISKKTAVPVAEAVKVILFGEIVKYMRAQQKNNF
jgi:hypothetical protein